MRISRKILIAAAFVAVAIEAAPASATSSSVTMSVGITITAPVGAPAHPANSRSKASAARISTAKAAIGDARETSTVDATTGTSRIAKSASIRPEVTTRPMAEGHSNEVVQTLSY